MSDFVCWPHYGEHVDCACRCHGLAVRGLDVSDEYLEHVHEMGVLADEINVCPDAHDQRHQWTRYNTVADDCLIVAYECNWCGMSLSERDMDELRVTR